MYIIERSTLAKNDLHKLRMVQNMRDISTSASLGRRATTFISEEKQFMLDLKKTGY
jgi:hypothetical protein